MNKPIIELQNLSIGYLDHRPHKVVHAGMNLQLQRGELTCLLGTNGAGKSTLIKTLAGFQPALAGHILLEGKQLRSYSRKTLARLQGVVLTDPVLSDNLTVYELVSFGRYAYTGFFGRLTAADHRAVEEALTCIGIPHFASRHLHQLSDGERQKVMIAKAIAQGTSIILLDEPTAFLDLPSRVEIMLLLRKLTVEQGITVLLSTHDIDLAMQISDKIWLMAKRRQTECGTPEDLALSGMINSFFDKEALAFDLHTGSFRLQVSSGDRVSHSLSGLPSFWVEKALTRKGFRIVSPTPGVPHITTSGSSFFIDQTPAANVEEILSQLRA